jgi:hypothetical protein
MVANRLTGLIAASLVALASFYCSIGFAQTKYTISKTPDSKGQYLQQHAIDVDDVAGHQVRVFETRTTFPAKDFSFGGVAVKESFARGMSDYVNFSGPYINYTVYMLEDGNKVFARSAGSSQSETQPDGSQIIKFSFTENFVGGTGKFKGIRGQVRGSGERVPGGKSASYQLSGEYWLEE